MALALAAAPSPNVAVKDVSPAMLAAGKGAFLKERAKLDDLYEFFDCDLTVFLTEIYCAMASEMGA